MNISDKITFLNQNNIEVMKTIPDNYFDLVIDDPPYGLNAPNMSMGTSKKRSLKGDGVSVAKRLKGKLNTGDGKLKNRILNKNGFDWDNEIPSEEYFKELFRISKNQIIWGGNYFTEYLYNRQCWLVWDKGQRDFTLADGELAWTSYDKALRIFTMSRAAALQEKKGLSPEERHPTMKPEKLFKWCIQEVARINKGDDVKIFDPFMGSGTTAVVCEDLELKWSGCELEVDYIKLANKRLSQVQGSLF